ncbi:SoxR reducing system RseC family protein [Sideroxyarcus emersonii]|nr:SoxR reducing system RseC family protein [Sideroxyarcus emersonii]
MMDIRAIVIEVHGEDASVQPVGTGGCGHCSSEGGCGSGTLTKLFCSNKARQFKVRNEVRAQVGDQVEISIADGVLLRGAVKMYVLPLLLLLAGGAVGAGLANEPAGRDACALAGAVFGLTLGFLLAKLTPGSGRATATSIVKAPSVY